MTMLDPQAAAFLEAKKQQDAAAPVPQTPPTPLEKLQAYRQLTQNLAALGPAFEEVEKVENFEAPAAQGKVPVRLYIPAGAQQRNLPVFVFCHGGAFMAGSVDSYDRQVRALANRSGVAIASVEYRLAPEHPYPAANDDVWSALLWLREQASTLGLDANRIAVGGDSAGGLLAAWVAQKAAHHGIALRLQLLVSPTMDPAMSRASWKTLGTGEYIVEENQMQAVYGMYLTPQRDRKDPEVSPLYAADVSRIAPAYIATADHDPLWEEGEAYADKLKAAGVAVQYTCLPGMIHDPILFAAMIPAGAKLIDDMGAALHKAMA